MRAPVAAYVFVLRVPTPSAIILASLGPPITSDFDVFGAAAILLTGLVRLLRRLPRLNKSGLSLNRRHAPLGDHEPSVEATHKVRTTKILMGHLHHRNRLPTACPALCSEITDLFCCRIASNGISQPEELKAHHRSAGIGVCPPFAHARLPERAPPICGVRTGRHGPLMEVKADRTDAE
jgi:hypothetical protein